MARSAADPAGCPCLPMSTCLLSPVRFVFLWRLAVFFGRYAAKNWLVQSPLVRRVAVPVEWLVACCDHHALGIEMIVETFGAAFAADAAVTDAAPGRGRVEAVMVVDPDDAGLDGRGDAMRAADVAGADRGCEAEWRIIGEAQRVGLIPERRHRGEGT